MSKVETVEVKQLGRPVNPNSVRQMRLAELEMKRSNGELKKGRPVDPNSPRQLRLKAQAENKAKGIGQGRPVNPTSARQQRLAELEAKKVANGGTVKRGRPAVLKVEGEVEKP
jgi:translation initiation factor 1 (eIF-1/SUI1)